MIFKGLKWMVIATAVMLVAGLALFGGDLLSYVRSSAGSMRAAVKDSVPVEFELRRAHDMLGQVLPELQANVRLIAQEEVEVANLREDIRRSEQSLAQEQARIRKVAGMLEVHQAAYTIGDGQYTHAQLKDDLRRRFDRYKEAEMVLSGKQRLLETRQSSLQAAMRKLEAARAQKALLEDKIAALEAQHRLIVAAGTGSNLRIDDSKLAQTDKLIGQIKKRLDVAERVLAHEARFAEAIPVDAQADEDLVAQVHDYFGDARPAEAVAQAAAFEPGAVERR